MAQTPLPPSLAALLSADLPSPLKALAGLAVTAIEDARALPERVSELPSHVLTRVAAHSMRAQQQYAAWVAKGEALIGSLRTPSEETPPWATFDEDLPASGLGPGSAFDRQPDVDDLPVARRRTPAKKAAPAAKKAAPAVAKKAAPAAAASAASGAPQSLPDFDTLTIPQLRSRLKTLKSAELEELIAYEQANAGRAAVVQMLRARLETLQK